MIRYRYSGPVSAMMQRDGAKEVLLVPGTHYELPESDSYVVVLREKGLLTASGPAREVPASEPVLEGDRKTSKKGGQQ